MLNIIGNFIQKFDSLLQVAFASIEKSLPKQQSRKNKLQLPPPTKNKWQMAIQKRQKKEKIAKERMLQNSALENRKPVMIQKPPETEGARKMREQLFVSLEMVRKQQQNQLQILLEKMGVIENSFNLPKFISFVDKNLLSEDSLKFIYQQIFNDIQEHLSKASNLIDVEPISILENKIILFPSAFTKLCQNWNAESLIKRLQDYFSNLNLSPNYYQANQQQQYLQVVLTKLRRAKMYRYDCNIEVQSLIGSYFQLKDVSTYSTLSEEDSQILLSQDLEITDIGLLSPESYVTSRQEAEIIYYWSLRSTMKFPSGNSRYNYNQSKVIDYLRINAAAPLTMSNYIYYLTKLQNRLIIIEQQRAYNTIKTQMKLLDEAEKSFDQYYSQLAVVEDKKSAVRKPLHPKPLFNPSTSLRLFTKWRSTTVEDGLSVGSIMQKIINKQVKSFYETFCLLLRDYDNQVTIPRNWYIHQLMVAISTYDELKKELQSQQSMYKKFQEYTGYSTPKRRITIEEPMAPRKQRPTEVINLDSESQSSSENMNQQKKCSQSSSSESQLEYLQNQEEYEQDSDEDEDEEGQSEKENQGENNGNIQKQVVDLDQVIEVFNDQELNMQEQDSFEGFSDVQQSITVDVEQASQQLPNETRRSYPSYPAELHVIEEISSDEMSVQSDQSSVEEILVEE